MKLIKNFIVVNKTVLNSDYFTIELSLNEAIPHIIPGQFVEVNINKINSVFLRRPFSVHDVNYEKNTLTLLIQIVGNATKELSNFEINSTINVIFPLGNGYSLITNKKTLLIGGGCGIAPLLLLAKELVNLKNELDILIGVRNKENLILIDKYKKLGNVHITTEDGSIGEKGYVTNSNIFNQLSSFNKIYTCGPEVMMKAVFKKVSTANIDCEVSLENNMACGIGACLCCVTETTEGNKCVCTEGPVFNPKYLKWQN